jgi:hypothetical protein
LVLCYSCDGVPFRCKKKNGQASAVIYQHRLFELDNVFKGKWKETRKSIGKWDKRVVSEELIWIIQLLDGGGVGVRG